MKLLTTLLVSTIAVFISAYVIPGVFVDSLVTAAIIAVVLGVLNTFIKPILVFLTLPITLLTFGLFLFIINVFLVLLAEYLVPGFSIDTFLTAILFSIVLSLVTAFLTNLLK